MSAPPPLPIEASPVDESPAPAEPAPAPSAPWVDPFLAAAVPAVAVTRLVLQPGGSPAAPPSIDLGKPMALTVGGDGDRVDLLIDVQAVSGRHARFELSADGVVSVVDLGSSNGTYVDG